MGIRGSENCWMNSSTPSVSADFLAMFRSLHLMLVVTIMAMMCLQETNSFGGYYQVPGFTRPMFPRPPFNQYWRLGAPRNRMLEWDIPTYPPDGGPSPPYSG